MKYYFSKGIAIVFAIFLMTIQFSTSVFAAGMSDKQTPSGIPFNELKSTIDSYTEAYIGKTTAGASVAILKNDELLFQENYGYADIANNVLVDNNTLFEWGSASKLFIWVSAMQLVEQGKLDLNEDIRSYLPDNFFKKLTYDNPITIQNLMNHNGGWEEHLTDMFYTDPSHYVSLEESLRLFEPKQIARPGEIFSYSNYGASLAALVIERISGIPYYEYINKNIFIPLSMDKTSIHPLQADNEWVKENRPATKGYMLSKTGFSQRDMFYLTIYPSGGAVGTITDFCRFASALMPKAGETTPLFLSNSTLEEMLTKSYEPAADVPGIAHGFFEHYYRVKTLEHGGNTDAFSAQIAFAPREGIAVLVMTNQAHERNLCIGIKDKIFGSYASQPDGSTLPNSSEVEGQYRSLRRPYSGFSQWLNFIVTEVKTIDENTIDMDGDIYQQIKPYVYQYTDEGGSSEIIYFNVQNGKMKSLHTQYGEYEPVGIIYRIYTLGSIALIALSFIYFAIAAIKNIILVIIKRPDYLKSNKMKIILNTLCLTSAISTCMLFIRSMTYQSYMDLRFHLIYNIICAILVVLLLAAEMYSLFAKETKRKKICIYQVMSLFWVILIAVCQLYI